MFRWSGGARFGLDPIEFQIASESSTEGCTLKWKNRMEARNAQHRRSTMNLDRTLQPTGSFNTLGRRLGVVFPVLCLATALILGAAMSNESRAATITVPNGDFETLYKPGTAITGGVSPGGYSQGVGLDCPIDGGEYQFSDATTGDVADIPGWVGYDTGQGGSILAT